MLGIVGKKIGMSRIYDSKGSVTPVTLIQVYECCVVAVKEFVDYNNVTFGFGAVKNPNKLTKPLRESYVKKGLQPHKKMLTVRMAKDKTPKVGDTVSVDVLTGVIAVDVTGISKGKGFAGGIKRWHFKGLEASHGVSISHRSIGSTGNRKLPGKVFAGKKMPGQLGNKRSTVKNLKIVEIDPNDRLVCVKGGIPGSNGSDVVIKRAKRG